LNSCPYEILNYLQELKSKNVPITEAEEEKAPDIAVGQSDKPITADHIWNNKISPKTPPSRDFNYFLDGIQRTVIVKQIPFTEFSVPIHFTHIAAGIIARDPKSGKLKPFEKVSALVVIGPFRAIQGKTGKSLNFPPDLTLDSRGNIYTKIKNQSVDTFFISDTSLKLRNEQQNITQSSLGQIGLLRRKALDRVKVLRAILELGLTYEFLSKNENDSLVIDGPLVNLETYKRLISREYLQTFNSPKKKFNHLKRVIGSVKTVIRIPNKGTPYLLSSSNSYSYVYAWKLGDVTSDFARQLGEQVISAIFQLRPALIPIMTRISSGYSALVRFDIPVPLIIPDKSQFNDSTILNKKAEEIVADPMCDKQLRNVIESLLSERWIYPQKNSHRSLVELYPIEIVEKWLSANLKSPYALKSMLNR